jgi:dihydrofolate reductase
VTATGGAGGAKRPAEGSQRIALVLVAAVGENGVIGRDGGLPWRLKSDLRHFRAATIGKPIVMGRKTFHSIGRPLPGRTNIVVSRDSSFAQPGVVVAPSLDAALAVARGDALRRGADEIAVIGGADIYAQTIERADRLVVTRVKLQPAGETRFPDIDPACWTQVHCSEHPAGPDDEAGFAVLVYQRGDARAMPTGDS